MFWYQGAQNIGLSHHKLKSALSCTYDHNARPSQTDGQTDEHHGNSARFVLTNASRANDTKCQCTLV